MTRVWRLLLLAPALLSASPPVFEDLSVTHGFGGTGSGQAVYIAGGAAFVDLEPDGDVDIVHVPPTGLVAVYRKEAGLSWTRDPIPIIPDTPPGTCNGVIPADIDGDGDPDLLFTRGGTPVLFRNDGSGFTDISAFALPGRQMITVSGSAGDFDADGDVDLFIGAYLQGSTFPWHRCANPLLLENDGAGVFAEVPLEGAGCALATAMSDVDGDRDLDLLVINDFGAFVGPNRLWRNDGPGAAGWTFTDVSAASGFDLGIFGMGVGVRDLDGDGLPELAVTNIGRTVLLRRDGPDEPYADVTDALGARVTYASSGFQVTWGAAFVDANLDGHSDLIASGGPVPAAGFLANPTEAQHVTFEGGPDGFALDAPGWSLPAPPGSGGRGLSVGDLDADGRPDLVISHASTRLSVYRNVTNTPPALRVRALPRHTRWPPVGARVTGECAGERQVVETQPGGAFAGAHEAAVWLAFAAPSCRPDAPAPSAIELTVRFPSGYVVRAQAEPGGSIDVSEPAWLGAAGGKVRATPVDEQGPIAVERLAFTGDPGVELGVPETSGPMLEQAVAGVGRVGLLVDGVRWPATLRLGATGLVFPFESTGVRARATPQLLSEGRAASLVFWSAEGPPAVSLGGAPLALEVLDPGVYRAVLPAVPAGPSLNLTVAGEPWSIPVAARVDAAASRVIAERLVRVDGSGLAPTFRVEPCDANGRCDLPATLLSATIDGAAAPAVVVSMGDAYQLTLSQLPPDGSQLSIIAAGTPLFQGEVHVIGEAADTLALVDSATSRCGAVQPVLYADGDDAVTFAFDLRAADGQRLPVPASLKLEGSGGLEGIPASLTVSAMWSSLRARTKVVGVLEARLATPTQVLPVVCRVRAVPPAPAAVDIGKSSLELLSEASLPEGALALLRVTARTASGRLAGPGHLMAVETSHGSVLSGSSTGTGISYYAVSASTPGTAEVTARIDGVPLSQTVSVTFGSLVTPDAAGDVVDGNDADTVANEPEVQDSEVSPDAVEASPEIVEEEPDTTAAVEPTEVEDAPTVESSEGDASAPDPAVADTSVQPVEPDSDDVVEPDRSEGGNPDTLGPSPLPADGRDGAMAEAPEVAGSDEAGPATMPGDGGCSARPVGSGAWALGLLAAVALRLWRRRAEPDGAEAPER